MANIWRVYEGSEPTRGRPWLEMPFDASIAAFNLKPTDFVSELTVTPRFGRTDRNLTYKGHKYIVVEVDAREARRVKWRGGFYVSPVLPDRAFERLLEYTAREALGDQNVVGVRSLATTDSNAREALRVTIVLHPAAVSRLDPDGALNARLSLQGLLQDLEDERTLIVEYATAAELLEHAEH